jgi:glycosyltransferase involved in cell wall biosynthesis
LAGPLGDALKRPICCTLQGEDLFLDGLIEPYRQQALDLIRAQVPDVARFIAVSDYYVPVMSRRLHIPADRIAVVPLGINLSGYVPRPPVDDDGVFRVGYFARLAPEKGLHLLADAYVQFRSRTAGARVVFEAAGYLSRADEPYLERVRKRLEEAGAGGEFTYQGAVDRDGKLAFLRSLDVLSVPATYDEPKGVFLLEAMASGVPVVQPRRGAFTEIVERTGGGLLVAPDDPSALADGLYTLWRDRTLAAALGARGAEGVAAHYSVARSADRLLDVYDAVRDSSKLRHASGL